MINEKNLTKHYKIMSILMTIVCIIALGLGFRCLHCEKEIKELKGVINNGMV